MDLNWQYIQDNFDWLGHIVEALCIAAVVTALGLVLFKRRIALIIGLAFASGHFHGREKRDFEVSVHMRPPHLRAYEIWNWSWDQATDFWPVAAVILTLLVIAVRYKAASPSAEHRLTPRPPQTAHRTNE